MATTECSIAIDTIERAFAYTVLPIHSLTRKILPEYSSLWHHFSLRYPRPISPPTTTKNPSRSDVAGLP